MFLAAAVVTAVRVVAPVVAGAGTARRFAAELITATVGARFTLVPSMPLGAVAVVAKGFTPCIIVAELVSGFPAAATEEGVGVAMPSLTSAGFSEEATTCCTLSCEAATDVAAAGLATAKSRADGATRPAVGPAAVAAAFLPPAATASLRALKLLKASALLNAVFESSAEALELAPAASTASGGT